MAFNSRIIEDDVSSIIKSLDLWSQLKSSTFLITGATGFLPSYLIFVLIKLNIEFGLDIRIIALARNENKVKKKFKDVIDHPNLSFCIQDVTDAINIDNKVDYIVHAASQASPKYYKVDPVGTLMANTIGTKNLLEFARDQPVKSFLFFSSSEIYGERTNAISEASYGAVDPLEVRSCYAESKRAGENMCTSWFHQYGVPAKVVRPFHTYGPGMDLQDGRVYADFARCAVEKRNIEMTSDGTARRSFCYLSDATKAFFLVLLKGLNGHAYNVGNPNEEYSIVALAEKLVQLYPERKMRVVKKVRDQSVINSNVNRNLPDITKLEKLGWFPTVSVEVGFRRVVSFYEE